MVWTPKHIINQNLNIFLYSREKGEQGKQKEYLPADKQYLLTRGGELFF